jgi:hypothetical protein
VPRRDQRLPPIEQVGDGYDGDDDQDQHHESRANPAAAEQAGARVGLIRLVGEELGNFVADLAVGSFEGLQPDLELPLLREGPSAIVPGA